MANMSYCRFTNTKADLEDCLYALREEEKLSDFEAGAGHRMFDSFLEYCEETGIIEGFDRDTVKVLFERLYRKEENDE